jgi:hypothetical protein
MRSGTFPAPERTPNQRKEPQKRWIRWQASSSAAFDVA